MKNPLPSIRRKEKQKAKRDAYRNQYRNSLAGFAESGSRDHTMETVQKQSNKKESETSAKAEEKKVLDLTLVLSKHFDDPNWSCHDRGGKRCDSLKRHSSHDRLLDKRQHKRFERSQSSGHDDHQRSRSPQVCNRSLVAPTATVKVKGLPKEATEESGVDEVDEKNKEKMTMIEDVITEHQKEINFAESSSRDHTMETVQKQSNKKESERLEKAEEKKVFDLTLVLSKHFDDPNWQKEKKMMMIEDVITEQQKKINRQNKIERAMFRNKYRNYIAGLQNFAELSSRPCHDRQRSRSPQVCNRSLVAPTALVKVKGLSKEATEESGVDDVDEKKKEKKMMMLEDVITEQKKEFNERDAVFRKKYGIHIDERESSLLTRRAPGARNLAGRFRLGSWNVGSLNERELADTATRRHVNILCVQETKWKGQKAKDVDGTGFRLWYTGAEIGVGILIDGYLKDKVISVRRQGDWIIQVRLLVGNTGLNVISAYSPQVGLNEEDVKRQFWEDLDAIVREVPSNEKIYIGGHFNGGHIGTSSRGFERVHGGFGYGDKNQQGEEILNFAVAYDLMIANTFFQKRESHLVTYSSGQHASQIDFILTRRDGYRRECVDCKVIAGECVVSQHRLLVSDFHLPIRIRRDRGAEVTRKTNWGKLKEEFKDRVMAEGMWNVEEEANITWEEMATRTRKVAAEVLEVARGSGTWSWNKDVQKAIKEKKECYKGLLQNRSEENVRKYKEAKKNAKRAMTEARGRAYEDMYRSLGLPLVKVKGLPKEATVKYLHHVLAEWRPLIHVRVMKNDNTSVCQGFAFITFPSLVAAQKMMDAIGVCGLHVNGRKLSFEYCMTEDQRKENMERAKIRLQKKLQTGTFEENMEEEDEIATLGLGPIAEELEIKIQQAPSSSDSKTTSISQDDLEELMICVKKDPYLKPIVEDIETGGPIVMMRYLDDPEVFQKLAQAMGFGDLGANSLEHNAPNADAEAQTAK